jgi:folate-binding protein YgfZ
MWLALGQGSIIYGHEARESRDRMAGNLCLLRDRDIIEVKGADAPAFLQRLITNSVLDIPNGESRYAALLTPQGKLLFDFFVIPLPGETQAGYLIDSLKEHMGDLIKRLNLHKMRANITITDQSGDLGIAAIFGGDPPEGIHGIIYRDMRTPNMGLRVIVNRDTLLQIANAGEADYEAHRIAEGVPKGGADFAYGDAFVHEANLDLLNGVDFKKGCYVGQEVVARVEFRKSARKRIVKIRFDGEAPTHGTQIAAGDVAIGQVGSTSGQMGLAMVRLDRLEEARTAGALITAGDATVEVSAPPEFKIAAGLEQQL